MTARRRGYSLLEIMVAISIFLLIMGAAFLPFKMLKDSFKKGSGHIDTHATVRRALDKMVRELRKSSAPQPQPMGMFYPKTSGQAMGIYYASTASGQSNYYPAVPAGCYPGCAFTLVRPDGYVSRVKYECQSVNTGAPTVVGDGGYAGRSLFVGGKATEYRLHRQECYYKSSIGQFVTEDRDVIPRGVTAFYFYPQPQSGGAPAVQFAATSQQPSYTPTSTPASPWPNPSPTFSSPLPITVENPYGSTLPSPATYRPEVYVYLKAYPDDYQRPLPNPPTAFGYFEFSLTVALRNQAALP